MALKWVQGSICLQRKTARDFKPPRDWFGGDPDCFFSEWDDSKLRFSLRQSLLFIIIMMQKQMERLLHHLIVILHAQKFIYKNLERLWTDATCEHCCSRFNCVSTHLFSWLITRVMCPSSLTDGTTVPVISQTCQIVIKHHKATKTHGQQRLVRTSHQLSQGCSLNGRDGWVGQSRLLPGTLQEHRQIFNN